MTTVLIARVCHCGHYASDHEPECMYGWGNEPDETETCVCEAFVYRADLVADVRDSISEQRVSEREDGRTA